MTFSTSGEKGSTTVVSFQRNLASTDFHQKYDFESQTELKTCEKKKNRKTLQFVSFVNQYCVSVLSKCSHLSNMIFRFDPHI